MRQRPEWKGKRPESMPTVAVMLRILKRQDGKCACGCGRPIDLNRDKADRDHILPLIDGGENVESNLQILLRDCHKAKTREENIGRAKGRRYQARTFDRKPPSIQGQPFPKRATKYSRARGCRVDAVTGEPVESEEAE